MRQPVTIGDQKFIWSDDKKAWIDEKTKVLANQGMQSLLEVAQTSQFHPVQESNETVPIDKLTPSTQEVVPYNNEPVNIGGQKFILDPKKGWIDEKTKQQASKDVVKLLEKITGVKVEEKKLGVGPIEIEPITIGGTKYAYDPKKKEWYDFKSKQRADDALQELLSKTINKAGISKLTDLDNVIPFGAVGDAAKEKVKPDPTVEKAPPKRKAADPVTFSKKSKSLLTQMINKLQSIDNSFREQSKLIAQQNRAEYAQEREDAIEDAAKVGNEIKTPHASKTGTGGKLLGVGMIVGIILTQFKPIVDTLETAYTSIKAGYDHVSEAVVMINKFFDKLFSFTGGSSNNENQEPSTEVPASTTPIRTGNAPTPVTPAEGNKQQRSEEPDRKPAESVKQQSPVAAALEATTTAMAPERVEASAPMKKSKPADKEVRGSWFKGSGTPVADAKAIVQQMFPGIHVTSARRKAGTGKAGKGSWHVKSGAAVDVKPVKGMSFRSFVQSFRNAGYTIIEAIDETIPANMKKTGATGPHWHIVLGKGGSASRVRPGTPNDTPQTSQSQIDQQERAEEYSNPEVDFLEKTKLFAEFLLKLGKSDSSYLGSIEKMTQGKTNRIAEITAQKYADMVNQPEEERLPMVLELPNINRKGGSTVQTPSTSFDKRVVEQYLRYFGYNPKTINL
jgi:hypothetical protein